MTISRAHLESSVATGPLFDAGWLKRYTLVDLNNWPEATPPQWAGLAQDVKQTGYVNFCGWLIAWLMLDETAGPGEISPKNRLVTAKEIAYGIQDGVLPWRKLIPRATPFFSALRSAGAKIKGGYLDDTERQMSVAVKALLGKADPLQAEQMFLQAAYNAAVALFNYFDQPASAVVCASVSGRREPWSYPVACVTPHEWYDPRVTPGRLDAGMADGTLINISLGVPLYGVVRGLSECACSHSNVAVNLYHEKTKPDGSNRLFDDNLNDPALAVALRACVESV